MHVAGRDVNIGSSTCSLFCFTLARAMLADTIDCTCNDALAAQLMPPGNVTADITDAYTCSAAPVMCSINAYAARLFKQHMKPALVCIVITALASLALLCLLSGTVARLTSELRELDVPRSSSISADADMRISTGSSADDTCAADQPRRAGRATSLV